MEKNFKTIIGVLAALVVVLIGILIYVLSQKTELKENVQVLTVDKQSLTEQLTQLQSDYATLSSTNDTINNELEVEREKVASLIEKLKKTQANDQAKLRKYEKELGTLRSIMRGYIKQIDSLNQLNISLKQEATEARQQAAASDNKYKELKTTTDELSKQVDKGSVVRGRGLSVIALNSRGKETNRSSRVTQLRSCLSLVENSIAQTGLMTVYIRVKGPDEILMTDGSQNTFTVDGEPLIYSASREVDYQGEEIEVCIYFNPGVELAAGAYTVEAYTSKGKIGTAQLYLK
ncbi:MAG: hypothetical protein ACI3Y2_04375 [Candidatus Egerieousia sp.]